jgi:uncharacterized protein (TIGR01244 family)
MKMTSDARSQRLLLALFPALVLGLVLALLALAATAAGADPVAPPTAGAPAPAVDAAALLPNGKQPLPGVLTGGQPSHEQLAAIAAAGYRTVVNLRTPAEAPPVLADRARELGLRYIELPVAGAGDLTAERAAALGELLADRAANPVAVYCASGNRVGALLALEQAQVEGKAPAEALAIGVAAGLKGLEPEVRSLLKLPDA